MRRVIMAVVMAAVSVFGQYDPMEVRFTAVIKNLISVQMYVAGNSARFQAGMSGKPFATAWAEVTPQVRRDLTALRSDLASVHTDAQGNPVAFTDATLDTYVVSNTEPTTIQGISDLQAAVKRLRDAWIAAMRQ